MHPDWRSAIEQRLQGLRLNPSRHRDVVEELSQHLDDRYRALRAGGVDDDEARREALLEIDDRNMVEALAAVEAPAAPELAPIGERSRGYLLANVWQDLAYAVRVLRKNPGFSVVAIVTLALGIGATTAIFSVVNGVMLRPLPFANADRLVRIWESDLPRGRPEFAVSQPTFLDFRAQNHSFERMAATTGVTMTLATSDGVEPVTARAVSLDFLPALGAAPAMGRNFLADEDRPGGQTRVAIITHGFWRGQLGSDPTVLGKTVTLNDAAYSIVGVMGESFVWLVPGLDLLVPLAASPTQQRGDHRLLVFGLLKPGFSLEQAAADMRAIAAQLSAQYPDSNGGWSVLLRSFYEFLVPSETRRMLLVFLAAVGCVLLIASSNVANLLLARAAARQKEMSIRVALGAGRGRMLSQMLVESVLLALVAGALGCAIAVGATAALKGFGPGIVPRIEEVTVDGRVLLFAFVVSIATGVLFGLAPAIHASRPNLNESLKDAGRTGSGGGSRQRLRDSLVVVEVALSVALLVGAGLLIRSMWTLQNIDPGFDSRNLLTLQVSVTGPAYQADARRNEFFSRALDTIRALPGVSAAAASSTVPMGGGNTSIEVVIEGRDADAAGVLPSADWRVVSPGYFGTFGVPVRGRDFDDRDVEENPTAIISEEMARRYWPGVDPVGRSFFWHNANGPRLTVVGVAGNVRHLALDTDPAPVIYLPSPAFQWNPMFLTIRTASDPGGQTAAVRHAVRSIDPKVPISSIRTGDEILATSVGPRRFNMFVLAAFAAAALILASVGLFGVMSYLVSQRTHDIGVRLALGALPRDVLRLVVGRGMVLASLGAIGGIAAAFWLGRSLEALLFQVRPTDPMTFAAVVLVLLAVSAIACYVPARRATRVDPVIALRYE
jgi:putative ABC transport system permease protein